MREKMLVTQALDERDLLVKKISDKIDKASFVDTIKPNEDRIQAAGVEWRKIMTGMLMWSYHILFRMIIDRWICFFQ